MCSHSKYLEDCSNVIYQSGEEAGYKLDEEEEKMSGTKLKSYEESFYLLIEQTLSTLHPRHQAKG